MAVQAYLHAMEQAQEYSAVHGFQELAVWLVPVPGYSYVCQSSYHCHCLGLEYDHFLAYAAVAEGAVDYWLAGCSLVDYQSVDSQSVDSPLEAVQSEASMLEAVQQVEYSPVAEGLIPPVGA